MTDNQKIAYEWAKSHDYPSIAARYARELAGLVDDLQGAYDAMVRDLTARTRQVRQLQGEISALRQQEHFREVTKKVEPLTNAQKIRSMSDEELVNFLMRLMGHAQCFAEGIFPYHPCPQNHNCKQCGIDWLQQPAEED